MQNYIRDEHGHASQTSFGTTYTSSPLSRRTYFFCTNGQLAGDRVSATPMGFEKHVYSYGRGVQTIVETDNIGRLFTNVSAGALTSLVDVPNGVLKRHPSTFWPQLTDRCMEKIFDDARGRNNLIVDLAESSQTLRMLKNTLKLRGQIQKVVADTVADVVRGKTRRSVKGKRFDQEILDAVTGKWLEYRYGWTPLVYSIYDAMDSLGKKYINRGGLPFKGRASASDVSSMSTGDGSYSSPSVTTTESMTARSEVQIVFAPRSGAQVYDWTSLNPLGIAWELLPLSFVADWVVNVSQQLSLWENLYLFQSQFRSGYQTLTWKIQRTRGLSGYSTVEFGTNANGTYYPNQVHALQKSAFAMFEERGKSRSPMLELPRPGGFRVEVSFGSNRQLDAAALLYGFIPKKGALLNFNKS